MSSPEEDWEQFTLKKLEPLKALSFDFAEYTAPTAEWEHDHCEGCWAKFTSADEPGALRRGYSTARFISGEAPRQSEFIQRARKSGLTVLKKPDNKVWVCPECFAVFGSRLGWKLNTKQKK